MPTLSTADFPPPLSWEELEELCWDLFSTEWKDANAVRNGRQGQPQSGVDLYGQRLGRGAHTGVQCRCHSQGSKLSLDEVLVEINKAERFVPALGAFIIATTSRRDGKLQRDLRQLSAERRARGSFQVEIRFWEDLRSRLVRNPSLAERHYPQFFAFRNTPDEPRTSSIPWPDRAGGPQFNISPGIYQGRLVCSFQISDALPAPGGVRARWVGAGTQMDWTTPMRENVPRGAAYQKHQMKPAEMMPTPPTDQITLEIRFNLQDGEHGGRWRWPMRQHEEKGHWILDSHLGTGKFQPRAEDTW